MKQAVLPAAIAEAFRVIEAEGHDNPREKIASLRGQVDIIQRNLKGNVVRRYDIPTSSTVWRFGDITFPPLRDGDGRPLPGDPLAGDKRQEVPLVEFMRYLNNWYHPAQRLREGTSTH